MANITLRSEKGSPFTNDEVDSSFNALNVFKVELTDSAGSIIVPAGTTAQRDTSPAAGYLRYNTTDSQLEHYNGSSWAAVGFTSTSDISEGTNLYYTDARVTAHVDSDYIELRRPAETIINVVAANGSAYTFIGDGFPSTSGNNPDIYVQRGTQVIINNASASGHPLEIRVSSGGSAYSTGVTGNTSAKVIFDVPFDAPDTLVYQCTAHAGMVGNIYVADIKSHTTADLAEGSNLYYTTARSDSDFDSRLATKTTANLAEGTNLYYTAARADSAARSALVALDAGGDGSFEYDSATGIFTYTGPSAAQVRAHFGAGEGIDLSSGTISGEDATVSNKGIASFATANFAVSSGAVSIKANGINDTHLDFGTGTNQISTADLPEATNLYYTDVRADLAARSALVAVDAGGDGSFGYDSATGIFTYTGPSASEVRAHFSGGTGITISSGSITTTDGDIVHDNTSGFVANEHIDHTAVSITAGAGLTGGGTIAATRNIAIGAGTGITVNANDIAIGQSVATNANVTFNTVALAADPTVALGAATKQYVDTIAAAGIHYHGPVRVMTTANLSAAYDNGSSGVGATLTNNSTQAALTIDGVLLTTNDRVLVQDQTAGAQNGVYKVTTVGTASSNWVLTRTTDTDSYAVSDPDAFGEGDAFFVLEGSVNAGLLEVMNTTGTITFGTTAITFTNVAQTAVYTAKNGVALDGTAFSIDSDANIIAATFQSDTIKFPDSDASHFVSLKSPHSPFTSNLSFTLPPADGTSGQALVTDGDGHLGFAAAGATITADTSTNTNFLVYFASTTSGALTAVKQDSGLIYNPSTGLMTATGFVGTLAGNVTGNVSGTAGSATGNAATATALATARNIGGVSFDGTAAINLPGVNTAGNQNTSGTAALATTVTVSAQNSVSETVYPTFVDGATGTQGIETDTGLNYNPSSGLLTSTAFAGDITGDVTGNADTATALANARTIGGVSFDGTAAINLPGVNTAGNQSTSGLAATATILATARTIGGVSFNGSAAINLPGVNEAGNQNTSGNAATATILATARNIGGVSFNGSAAIDLPGVNSAGNQNTSGTAAIATTVTLVATNATNATHFPVFSDTATGNENPRTDTGFTYNPSSGTLTSSEFAGNVTGTLDGILGGATPAAATATTIVANTSVQATTMKFPDSDASHFISLVKPHSPFAANVSFSLPPADGTAGQALVTDGAGHLGFAAAGATITSDTSTNTDFKLYFAAGTSGALTAVKQDSGLIYNPSTGLLTSGAFAGALTGNVTGNASTATALATTRAINGVNFDGSAAITVTAAAGTLSGSTLKATVTGSSLTSVGTIGTGTWQGTSIATTYTAAKVTAVNGVTGAVTAANLLTAIKTVDGTGSGLDADLLDGQSGAYYRINVYNAAGSLLN